MSSQQRDPPKRDPLDTADSAAQPVRRRARDGQLYTFGEFVSSYGRLATQKWASASIEPLASSSGDTPPQNSAVQPVGLAESPPASSSNTTLPQTTIGDRAVQPVGLKASVTDVFCHTPSDMSDDEVMANERASRIEAGSWGQGDERWYERELAASLILRILARVCGLEYAG